MKTGSMSILPSARYRDWLAEAAATRVLKVKESIQATLMDGLGDLALALARRPLARWVGSTQDLARLVADKWTWPEATAFTELAVQVGLLVPAPAGGELVRPLDVDVFQWLAARRVADTGDADGLMDHRMNGSLFDVFAMAAAITHDEQGAGLVRLYLERPGPYEEQLELGAALAATAMAWGAPADADVRADLLQRSIAWTQPTAKRWLRRAGTALMAAEAWDGPFADDTLEGAMERYRATRDALNDEELAGHPLLLATLETDLTVIIAAAEGDPELLEPLFDQLGAAYADRVGRAIGQLLPPGERKNDLLLFAARQAAAQDDPAALSALEGLVEPMASAIGPIHTAFQQVLEAKAEPQVVAAARSACAAIAHWRSCPELTAHLLARLVVAPVDPALRLGAAAALAVHPRVAAASRETVMNALERQFDSQDAGVRVAAVGAALHLGTEDPNAAALALGLIADGAPAEAIGPGLAYGLRRSPGLMAGLEHVWQQVGDEEPIKVATLQALLEVAESAHQSHELGPFYLAPPLTPEVSAGLMKALLPFIGDVSRPAMAAYAAGAAGWLARGDRGLALTLRAVRERMSDPTHRDAFTVALGAIGTVDLVVEPLATECGEGAPDRCAAAAQGLTVLFDTADQTAALDPWLPTITTRATFDGPQQEALLTMLYVLATAPLRGD